MKKLLILLLVCFYNCNDNYCKNSYQKERVLSYIETVEEYFILYSRREDEDLYIAVQCISILEKITGIKSQVSLGDIAVYEKKAFEDDKREWIIWANKNSCKLNSLYFNELDSTFFNQ